MNLTPEQKIEYDKFVNKQFDKLHHEIGIYFVKTMKKITSISNRCMNKLYELSSEETKLK